MSRFGKQTNQTHPKGRLPKVHKIYSEHKFERFFDTNTKNKNGYAKKVKCAKLNGYKRSETKVSKCNNNNCVKIYKYPLTPSHSPHLKTNKTYWF